MELKPHSTIEGGPGLISQAYHKYYQSGHYDRRYPNPNRTVWRCLLALLPAQAHVIDFGCGSGRYLLRLKDHVAIAAGFDISQTALDLLAQGSRRLGWSDLAILGPEPSALDAHVEQYGQADVVLCLFGVLGHIQAREDRVAALKQMRRLLKPGSGQLLISVPNVTRRFQREQRASSTGIPGLVRYTRVMDDTVVTLPYQLFDIARLRDELGAAGFTPGVMRTESVFPENWLMNHAVLRLIDSGLARFCPPRWGYGILTQATP